jgi:hypothetical protein
MTPAFALTGHDSIALAITIAIALVLGLFLAAFLYFK